MLKYLISNTMKNTKRNNTQDRDSIEIDLGTNNSRNPITTSNKQQIPLLNFQSHLIHNYHHHPRENTSSGKIIVSDYYSRNNYRCINKHKSNNDNYTSTKIDSKSIASKVFTSPRCCRIDKELKTTHPPIPKNKDNNVSLRLYNYGFYIKKKIETKKKDQEEQMMSRMKPKTNKSLIIEWDNPSITLKRPIGDMKKQSLSKQKDDDFSYRPSLNKHSLTIAKKLEPSCTRLIKKRKRNKSNNSYQSHRSSFELSYDYNSISNHHKKSNRTLSKKTPRRIQCIYDNAMRQLKQRATLCEANSRLKEAEFKNFPFKPNVSQYSMSTINILSNNSNGNATEQKPLSLQRHYKKQMTWKTKLENRNQKKRDQKVEDDLSNCTFSPKIDPLHVANDDKMIMRNLSQMNEYIVKRRNEIKKQMENEDYQNKRFFENNHSTFHIKTTQPKEFHFHPKNERKSCCRSDISLKVNQNAIIYERITMRKDNRITKGIN